VSSREDRDAMSPHGGRAEGPESVSLPQCLPLPVSFSSLGSKLPPAVRFHGPGRYVQASILEGTRH
jgi:hypothetical protein